MKHIVKGDAPQSFDDWKARENDEWKPTYGDLRNPQKGDVHEALLNEQGWVCCYCGRAVSKADSHIEHFCPQDQREDLALEFTNLFASCIRETKPGAPLHCGHAKGDEFDGTQVISPLDPACESRFIYTQLGEIRPADKADKSAGYMLKLLRLDIAFLRNRREDALTKVFDPDFLATASADELSRLAQAFRTKNAQMRIENFGHVVARYAEQMI